MGFENARQACEIFMCTILMPSPTRLDIRNACEISRGSFVPLAQGQPIGWSVYSELSSQSLSRSAVSLVLS
eukprot:scaffold193676_cov17-Prasinocladus_malaysianus.AAC.1